VLQFTYTSHILELAAAALYLALAQQTLAFEQPEIDLFLIERRQILAAFDDRCFARAADAFGAAERNTERFRRFDEMLIVCDFYFCAVNH